MRCQLGLRRSLLPLLLGAATLFSGASSGQGVGSSSATQRDIDPGLFEVIASIRAVDNHAHPVLPPSADPHDRNFDALPVDNMAPETSAVALRPDNPQLAQAWAALWHVSITPPLTAETTQTLAAARSRIQTREGQHYANWTLDQAGIDTMLANRVALGEGVEPPRFRWVPYADALLFPFNNTVLAEATPDRAQFFPLEDRVRAKYLHDLGLTAIPPTLSAYLQTVVTPTLERQKAGGAVAEKFEIAYLRSFDFTNPTREEAERVYTQLRNQPRPDSAQYKILQDYLFHYIATECGRLRLLVHLHTIAGSGGFFGVAGVNPLLLEPLLNDPQLRKTTFVLLHGGWPFIREAGALLEKPNVYLDISQQTLTFSPRTLSGWLREWLETYPDKVLFATDGYPYSDALGWEEATWIASHVGREALGLALTGMLRDGEISHARAEVIARDVLRNTALSLYPTH